MRKLSIGLSLAIAMMTWCGQAQAFGEWPFWPAYHPDAYSPYWPASRTYNYRVEEGCVRWNWQEMSYYNYCPSADSVVRRPRPQRALNVRG
jgi:hypothetical protein